MPPYSKIENINIHRDSLYTCCDQNWCHIILFIKHESTGLCTLWTFLGSGWAGMVWTSNSCGDLSLIVLHCFMPVWLVLTVIFIPFDLPPRLCSEKCIYIYIFSVVTPLLVFSFSISVCVCVFVCARVTSPTPRHTARARPPRHPLFSGPGQPATLSPRPLPCRLCFQQDYCI